MSYDKLIYYMKVDEKAMIRNRYNRIPHLALDTKRKGIQVFCPLKLFIDLAEPKGQDEDDSSTVVYIRNFISCLIHFKRFFQFSFQIVIGPPTSDTCDRK